MATAALVVLLLLAISLALLVIGLYNRLIFLVNQCDKAWYNIDVLLKQRHDEIPKLVAVCEGSMKFEKETLTAVINARAAATSAAGLADRVKAEGELTTALGRLLAVAENYPELKSTALFAQLSARVSQLETEIADRREYYNDAATTYNVATESFPSNLVAGNAGMRPRELFRAAPADTADVTIAFKQP